MDLPNLTSLNMNMEMVLLPYMRMLLTPKLTKLSTRLDYPENEAEEDLYERLAQSLLSSLPITSPNLQHLELKVYSDVPYVVSPPTLIACQGLCASIQSLILPECCFDINEVLEILGNASALTSLDVGLSSSSSNHGSKIITNLKSLVIHVETQHSALDFIEGVSLVHLNTMHVLVTSCSDSPSHSVLRFSAAVLQSCNVSQLSQFTLDWELATETQFSPIIVEQSIASFLPFHKMKSFRIGILEPTSHESLLFNITPDFWHRMMTSWPRLTDLDLQSVNPPSHWVPKLKLTTDLVNLITTCSELCSVKVDFDFDCEAEQLLSSRPCRLQALPKEVSVIYIQVRKAIAKKPKLVAAILSDSTVLNVRIRSDWLGSSEDEMRHRREWEDVNECLSVLTMLRKREHARLEQVCK